MDKNIHSLFGDYQKERWVGEEKKGLRGDKW